MKIVDRPSVPSIPFLEFEPGDVFRHTPSGHVEILFMKVANALGLRNAVDLRQGGLWYIAFDQPCTPVDAELVIK